MKREIRIFFTALMFYTRIPCPSWVGHEPEYINLSVRYFPLIGWLVGAGSFLGYFLGAFLFTELTGVLFSLAVSVLMTGAFHEDGFADACDGFGGGWTKERILTIMKDSRLGAFGAIGLMILLALKVSVLYALVATSTLWLCFAIFITSHALSRFVASIFIFTYDYVQDAEVSKAKPVATQTGWGNFWIALLFALTALGGTVYLTQVLWILLMLPVLAAAFWYLGNYYKKWIGGYTGDCLGAAQQIFELLILLTFLGVWKFI